MVATTDWYSWLTPFALVIVGGWTLLATTSACLLLPNPDAAKDRLHYAVFNTHTVLAWRILWHLMTTYLLFLPLCAYLWALDEFLYNKSSSSSRQYSRVAIQQPLITISVPRAGTTSFHRTLALDKEAFVTPTMVELVIPFLCVQKLIFGLAAACPRLVEQLEGILKVVNAVTPEVEARHPVSLLAPDADDILLGEWHWHSVGSVRSFPVPDYWYKHYQMINPQQRRRSMEFHRIMCQKIIYNRGSDKRLLLRSHLSPCIPDLQELYPDAIVVGIVRDPVDVLRSFAGLSTAAVMAATGVDILADTQMQHSNFGSTSDNNGNGPIATKIATSPRCTGMTWPNFFVLILADMMGREAVLYNKTYQGTAGQVKCASVTNPWAIRCHYVRFSAFKDDPVVCLQRLYQTAGLAFTKSFEQAIRQNLSHHETYKGRHDYKNPTLEELGIAETTFRSMHNVKEYAKLLQV